MSGPDLCSATGEDCLPRTGLKKRSDSDTSILSCEHGDERVLLEFQPGVKRGFESGVDDLLRESVGDDWPGSEFRRQRKGSAKNIGGRMDFVYESDRKRLLGPHLTSGQDQILSARRPDESSKTLCSPTTRNDPEEDFRLAELRVVGRDPKITRKGQLTSATKGWSMYCGNDDRRNGSHSTESLEKESTDARRFVGAVEFGDLGARRKDPFATGNDHCTGRRLSQIFRNLFEGHQRRRGKRIDLSVAQSYKCNAIFATFESYEFVGHANDPNVRHSPGWASNHQELLQRTSACASRTRVTAFDDRDSVPRVPYSPPDDHQSIAQCNVAVTRTAPNGSPTVVLS